MNLTNNLSLNCHCHVIIGGDTTGENRTLFSGNNAHQGSNNDRIHGIIRVADRVGVDGIECDDYLRRWVL